MNYLREMLTFYEWLPTHPQPKNAVLLWHAMMVTNNSCGWSKNFRSSMSVLMLRSCLSKKEFIMARKALLRCGRITMYEHPANEAAIYSMNPFFDENGDRNYYEEDANNYQQVIKENSPKNATHKSTCNTKKIANEGHLRDTIEVPIVVQNESILEPPVAPIKTKKRKENKIKENNLEEDKSSSSAGDVQKFNLISFFNEYNELCKRLPKAKIFSKRRSQEVGARYREHGEEAVHDVIRLAAESDFLSGKSNSGWRANFDWIFLPTNFIKILEGYYGNKSQNSEFADFHDPQNHRDRYADEYIGKPSPFQILEQSFKDIYGDDDLNY